MIAASRLIAAGCFGVALTAHVAAPMIADLRAAVLVEGGQGGPQAALGNGFEDLAAGTLAALATDDMAERVLPGATVARPVETTPGAPVPRTPEPATRPVAVLAPPVAPDAAGTPVPAPPARPEILAATEPDPAEAPRSAALPPRSRAVERLTASEPPPQTRRSAAARQGNAAEDARRGAADGAEGASRRSRQAAAPSAAQAGNAAVSNYPGQVMRRLQRAPKPRAGARGAALVSFRIEASGGLGTVSVARSSGSPALDSAAVRMVQGAAPFPPPPPGAQRSFSVEVQGR